jgi:serine/threonine protein kinase
LAREQDDPTRGLAPRADSSGPRPTAEAAESGENSRPVPSSARRVLEVGARLVGKRFEVRRYVGRGGMGVVYEAFDAERGCLVALKTLTQTDGQAIYDLKREFRSLVNVSHPNLVRFHELFCEAGVWFFTMDFVEGVHFDAWVRPGGMLDPARLRPALGCFPCSSASTPSKRRR